MTSDLDVPIRGEVRVVGFRRVGHGLYLRQRDDLSADDEWRRDLGAWLAVLPRGAVFTHVTAARLRGWRLPQLPEQTPVFAAVEGDARRPRRPGLICSRLRRTTRADRRHGLPVDSGPEILLRAARDLGVLDLVIMIDAARAQGDLEAVEMEELLASRRPGVRRLREAWRRSSARAESAGETVLRMFHAAMQVAVEPQVRILDEAGSLLGVADLLVMGTSWVHEYDGEVHRDKHQHRRDLRRERGLAGSAYRRRGFSLDDLLNHPAVTMHELDRALDRQHDQRRLERWRRLVQASLYSVDGRDRVLNRWRRAVGVVEWSRAA